MYGFVPDRDSRLRLPRLVLAQLPRTLHISPVLEFVLCTELSRYEQALSMASFCSLECHEHRQKCGAAVPITHVQTAKQPTFTEHSCVSSATLNISGSGTITVPIFQRWKSSLKIVHGQWQRARCRKPPQAFQPHTRETLSGLVLSRFANRRQRHEIKTSGRGGKGKGATKVGGEVLFCLK